MRDLFDTNEDTDEDALDDASLAVPPFQRHSPTSKEAAESVRPEVGTLREMVLRVLEAAGQEGLTDDEMQRRLAMNPSTQRPRRIELVRQGFVRDSGRTRKTVGGREAVVWVACGNASNGGQE